MHACTKSIFRTVCSLSGLYSISYNTVHCHKHSIALWTVVPTLEKNEPWQVRECKQASPNIEIFGLQPLYDYSLMIIYFVIQCCVSLAAIQVADICVSGVE